MMNRKEEILIITMEECSEVAIEASKMIRFGYEKNDRLEAEIGDLYCMIKLLEKEGVIDMRNVELCADAKMEKLKSWSNIFDDPEEPVSKEVEEELLPFMRD